MTWTEYQNFPSIVEARDIAWAVSTDAGNRSMRKAGRKAWNEDDWNVAVAELNRLLPESRKDNLP